jgi:hypothetical protein
MKPRLFVTFAFAAVAMASAAHAADPSVSDCLSATETSLRLRANQKLREARAQLLICSAATCPTEVRAECLHRMGDLNTSAPTVVFTVKTEGGQELSGVKVTMDGEVVTEHLDGSALSLDPGSHAFVFEAAGRPPLTKTMILHEGEKGRSETVVMESIALALPASPAASMGTAAEGDGRRRRVLGVAIGSGGIAALAVGGIFVGMAASSWSQAEKECPTRPIDCSPQAIHDQHSASAFAAVATAGLIAGGVLLAGGVTLYFTAPKDKTPSVGLQGMTVTGSPAGLVVAGSF